MAAWANNAKTVSTGQTTFTKGIMWAWNGVVHAGGRLINVGKSAVSFFWA